MPVNPVPAGYHTVTPYLSVKDAAKFLDFLGAVFGATVKDRTDRPDGTVAHAEALLGDSPIMLGEYAPAWPGGPAHLYLYVPDVDSIYGRAKDAGVNVVREPTDEFYGDRVAGFTDAWGNTWWVATHIEDVAPDELQRRMAAATKSQA